MVNLLMKAMFGVESSFQVPSGSRIRSRISLSCPGRSGKCLPHLNNSFIVAIPQIRSYLHQRRQHLFQLLRRRRRGRRCGDGRRRRRRGAEHGGKVLQLQRRQPRPPVLPGPARATRGVSCGILLCSWVRALGQSRRLSGRLKHRIPRAKV